MPELPEVEITRRGIEPHVLGHRISSLVVREPRLRWPVPRSLPATVKLRKVEAVRRRAKYLILDLGTGGLIIHLGMSGSIRMLPLGDQPQPHDHIDIVFDNTLLRYRDPRRFGCMLWQAGAAEQHPLLRELGVEPLGPGFSGEYLHRITRNREVAIKQLLMNQALIVGIGNIYASESLFRAGIRPQIRASRLSRDRCEALARAAVETLNDALKAGGSSLRDYVQSNGELGCFQLQTFVYERAGEHCRRCEGVIRHMTQGQRSTYYCPNCQQ
jgi:formamidopyrimidine-DNA glycosylase